MSKSSSGSHSLCFVVNHAAPATSLEDSAWMRIAIPRNCAYQAGVIFGSLQLWMDPVMRSGQESMAVDEWLLETVTLPVLRVYGWAGDWLSIGYFGKDAEAQARFPGMMRVRRWTGGGMVDHREGWTYSVVAPKKEPLASWRGAESYRRVHEALARTLRGEGIDTRMSAGAEETGAMLCFQNPVNYDLLGLDGKKLAGAGQRRSRRGLLHQGSVAVAGFDGLNSNQRARDLASQLAQKWELASFQPDPEDLARRVVARYGSTAWMQRY